MTVQLKLNIHLQHQLTIEQLLRPCFMWSCHMEEGGYLLQIGCLTKVRLKYLNTSKSIIYKTPFSHVKFSTLFKRWITIYLLVTSHQSATLPCSIFLCLNLLWINRMLFNIYAAAFVIDPTLRFFFNLLIDSFYFCCCNYLHSRCNWWSVLYSGRSVSC